MADVITTVGKNISAKRVGGLTANAFTYLAIGIGTTPAAVGDTQLESEITTGGGQRVNVTPTVTTNVLTLQNTFNFTASFAITECGVLNAATVGDLLGRSTFSAISVVNGDSLQLTTNTTFGS
jgi:hypothetical protein